MSEGKSRGIQPGRHQGHQKNGVASPRYSLWPWSSCLPPPLLPFTAPTSLGRKLKTGKKQGLSFPQRPLAGGAAFPGKAAWTGGFKEKWLMSVAPGRWGWHCPCRFSAGAQCWTALGTVAHQALVGLEARQGLAAGDGGQGAAEAQHGGRGVLSWEERAGEVGPTILLVCELGEGYAGVGSEGTALRSPTETFLISSGAFLIFN